MAQLLKSLGTALQVESNRHELTESYVRQPIVHALKQSICREVIARISCAESDVKMHQIYPY